MSWVMNSTLMPVSARRSAIRPRISRWVVTSSAVVGSSAMSSLGRQESAIAIITRWRRPPDSSCGCCRKRRAASAMRTFASMRALSSSASRRLRPRCRRSVSASWSPMASTGLSEVIGSWKIIAISAPRTRRISASGSAARSRVAAPPRHSTRPASIRPPSRAISRRTASAVADLPEPDSPTIASVSPGSTWKESPRTASTGPKPTRRPSTCSSGALMPQPPGRSPGAGRALCRRAAAAGSSGARSGAASPRTDRAPRRASARRRRRVRAAPWRRRPRLRW